MRTLIDTRLLALALKASYYTESDPVRSMAEQAQGFLDERLRTDTVCLSGQTVAELHHVLTGRGRRMPKAEAESLIGDLLAHEHVEFRVHDANALARAMALSTQSCVHLWDFLTFLPFEGTLDRIYSIDPHFEPCQELQVAPVENPFEVWAPEGKSEP